MHQSIFRYSITRPYPYKWFTWVVMSGGAMAIALFTIVNVAAEGYQLNLVYVSDPNDTEYHEHQAWHQKKPWSWAAKVTTVCQDQTFGVNSQIITNNTLLLYKITGIGNGDDDTHPSQTGTFAYHNDILHDCRIKQLIFTDNDDHPNAIVDVDVNIECTVHVSGVPTSLDLQYQSIYDAKALAEQVGYLDNHTQPALWWAALLMQAEGTFRPAETRNQATMPLLMAMTINPPSGWIQHPNSTEVMSIFSPNTNYTESISALNYWGASDFGSEIIPNYSILSPNENTTVRTARMDSLAKILYSYIMTDLGQSVDSNLVANGDRVVDYLNKTRKSFWSNHTTLCSAIYGSTIPSFIGPLPTNKTGDYSFDEPEHKDSSNFFRWFGTPVPYVEPATINARYICQVPRLKPIGSLLLSVIVSDIVFIQAAWFVFSCIARLFLERRDPDANSCSKCTKLTNDAEPNQKSRNNSITASDLGENPLTASFHWSDSITDSTMPIVDRRNTLERIARLRIPHKRGRSIDSQA